MFGNNEGKPVNLMVIENTSIEGKYVEAGTVLKNVPAEMAMDLAGAGKVRVATEAELAPAKKA